MHGTLSSFVSDCVLNERLVIALAPKGICVISKNFFFAILSFLIFEASLYRFGAKTPYLAEEPFWVETILVRLTILKFNKTVKM